MLAKSKWFRRRRFGGWGIYPITWQGWVYLLIVILPFVILQYIPGLIEEIKLWITIAWAGLLILDIVRIMLGISDDEREEKIEFLAERNAAWTMVLLIGLIILYQAMQSGFDPEFKVDWSLVVILFGGLIAKMISILVLKRKKL